MDPDDALPDSDFDGLNDFFESSIGSDPLVVDTDGDGLTDYEEAFHGTAATIRDSDYDGLTDGDEIAGWEVIYTFDENDEPLSLVVTSDPLLADTDGDTLLDSRERIYGFHPRFAASPDIANLTIDVEDADSIVAPGATFGFTTTLENRLNNRYLEGLLTMDDGPIITGGTIAPSAFHLAPNSPNSINQTSVSGQLSVPNNVTTSQTALQAAAGSYVLNASDEFGERLAWLRFNEVGSSPTSFANAVPSGNDGTCFGGCPQSIGTGYAGRAMRFDGVSDRVRVLEDGINDYSYGVSLWFKTDCHNCGIFEVTDGTASFDREIYLANGRICVRANPGSALCQSAATDRVDDDEWHNVIHVFGEGSDINAIGADGQRLYIDGIVVAENFQTFSTFAEKNQFWVGYARSATSDYFHGEIDEVELFGAALNPAEVTARFTEPVLDVGFNDAAAPPFDDASRFNHVVGCSGDAIRCPSHEQAGTQQNGYLTFNQRQNLVIVDSQALDLSSGDAGHFSLAIMLRPLPNPEVERSIIGWDDEGTPTLKLLDGVVAA